MKKKSRLLGNPFFLTLEDLMVETPTVKKKVIPVVKDERIPVEIYQHGNGWKIDTHVTWTEIYLVFDTRQDAVTYLLTRNMVASDIYKRDAK